MKIERQLDFEQFSGVQLAKSGKNNNCIELTARNAFNLSFLR